MNCPGSVALIELLPQDMRGRPSVHAQEGTFAHSLGETALLAGETVEEIARKHTLRDSIDREMIDYVQVYVDQCRKAMDMCTWWSVEERLDIGAALHSPAPMYGTGDFLSLRYAKLEVIDLKYGKGVVVEVVDNTQLKMYALGGLFKAIEKGHHPTAVTVSIVQPRVEHPDGFVRSATYDLVDLAEFAAEILAAARATMKADAPLNAGSWCRWCDAAAVCPARAEQSMAVACVEFDVVSVEPARPPGPETLTTEELAWVLERLPQLEEWAAQVRKFAHNSLEQGYDVPGQKLVAKRANRKWVDEDEVEVWARVKNVDVFEEPKLLSPAKVEKLVGKKNFPDEFTHKKSSGTTMVPESDRRPAIATDAFPIYDKENNS